MKTAYKSFIIFLVFVMPFIQLNAQNEVQRVRIDFETPSGFVRHLLLGFTPDNAATDGFDYGYDGANIENHPDDLNWMIEDNRYVIQGVGAFDATKIYPLGLFLTNSGTIKITLLSLENFESPIDVFIYDSEEDHYTNLNTNTFLNNINSGDYLDRYFVTFMENSPLLETLSLTDFSLENIQIKYSKQSRSLIINSEQSAQLNAIDLYSIFGQHLLQAKLTHTSNAIIPIHNISSNVIIVGIQSSQGTIHKKIVLQN